ncbi:MAG: AI-2E family transporter [Rhodoferax sp.]|nr:AI-2E family transporter [Rhodoferax sp.]
MRPATPDPANGNARRILLTLMLLVAAALGWILLPLFGIILWAIIIALLFQPLHRRLLVPLRHWRTSAALLTLAIAVVMVMLPLALVAASMVSEAAALYQRLQSGETNPVHTLHVLFDALPDWTRSLLDRFGLLNFDIVQRRLTLALAQGSQFIAAQALVIGQDTFEFTAGVVVSLYLAFFMIRDGGVVLHQLRRALPLAPEQKQELIDKFTTVVRATVKGNILVAAIQGTLGGLAFWYLGVGAPVLWAVLMAFLSLLPAVGAALVWLPVAVYFLAVGQWQDALALTGWGVCVIGLVDNLLRPMLVGKDTRMPDYVVLLTTLGGMAVFGINGFVLGPTIAAMFIAVWQLAASAGSDEP